MSWKEEDNKLKKEFKFKDFVQAMSWMMECAFHIEKLNHHPEWYNVYNTVKVELTTHDAGDKVTTKDYDLAESMDKCFEKYEGAVK